MTYFCGIYGYGIREPMSINGIDIIPKYFGSVEAQLYHRNEKIYHLTAFAKTESYDPNVFFDLEAILAFIERLDVLVSDPINLSAANNKEVFSHFPDTIQLHQRHNGGGRVIEESIISKNGREDFIKAALAKLGDIKFCEQTQFRGAFFKCVEAFRSPKPFLDVSYYFLFSALESFARGKYSEYDKPAAEPINRLLEEYAFNITIDNPADLKRAISTYCHIRNALFHNGKLEKEVNINGKSTNLRLVDFYHYLSNLVPLVMMKAVGFDDGHIDWDGWIGRSLTK